MQVMFEGILLKPSMVTPGADATKREKPEVVADYTLKLLRRRVPPAVPGECCNILIKFDTLIGSCARNVYATHDCL